MHISFACEGGFANLRLSFNGDTDSMSAREAAELVDAVDASGILTGPAPPSSDKRPVPDAMSYRITISEPGKGITWEVTDATAPVKLRPLIRLLKKAALARRGLGSVTPRG
jgi:hypothetical protein